MRGNLDWLTLYNSVNKQLKNVRLRQWSENKEKNHSLRDENT